MEREEWWRASLTRTARSLMRNLSSSGSPIPISPPSNCCSSGAPHFCCSPSPHRADANLHAEAKRPSKGFGKEVFERLVRMKENLAQLPDNIIRSLEIETVTGHKFTPGPIEL
eukprot:768667-Hanusia_phi.AAC.7